jgi:hypothetical protein
MKISVLTLALGVGLLSCKKEKSNEFTSTDVTGTSVVSGHVSKSVIASNGTGGWTNTARTSAQNVNVSITVNKNSLYPNANASGADVYRVTTDANGNYNIAVKSNATGVTAMVTIEGFTGTLDTMQVDGKIKTGSSAIFTGTTTTLTLYMGQNAQFNHDFMQQPVSSNPGGIVTGTALVTGSISVSIWKETTGAPTAINVPVPAGHKVYLRLANDPATLAPKTYETETDVNGNYSFNLSTVASGYTGFPQDATVWINDYAATRDTVKLNNTRVPGLSGVYQKATVTVNGAFNHSIKNAVYVRYTTFVPN